MTETNTSSRRKVVLTIAALLSLTTVVSLTYIYYKDSSRPSQSTRRFRALQKHLISQLARIEDDLDRLAEGDLRLTQVRTKTLRTYPCFPGDHHVQLPSLGQIQEEDKAKLGAEIQESQEELIRERSQGYEDPVKVRRAYHHLDLLVKSIQKKLLKLNAKIEVLDLSELAEVGDEASLSKESELQVFEKIRRRKRAVISRVQKGLALLDHLGQGLKERTLLIKEYERLERDGFGPTDDVYPTFDHEMMKAGITFAEVTVTNVKKPEILAPTEDLEKMKAGVSFAEVAALNLEEPEILAPTEDLEKMKAGLSFAEVAALNVEEPQILAPTEDLEKMKAGVSFAEVAALNVEEPEILAPTEDLEEMKAGVSFAEVAALNVEEPEILAPTEDLEEMKADINSADMAENESDDEAIEEVEPVDFREELTLTFVAETSPSRSSSLSSFMKLMDENEEEEIEEKVEVHTAEKVLAPTEDLELMKEGVTFAEMASHNIPEKEVLAPTEDLQNTKQGFTFANAVAEE